MPSRRDSELALDADLTRVRAESAHGAGPLPAGWAVHNDPSTGKPYYHNSSTGVTSWDFPQAGVVMHAEVSAAQDAQAALKLALALYSSRVDSERYAAALRNFPDREGWSTLEPLLAAAERSQLDNLSPIEVDSIGQLCDAAIAGSSALLYQMENDGGSPDEISAANDAIAAVKAAATLIKQQAGFDDESDAPTWTIDGDWAAEVITNAYWGGVGCRVHKKDFQYLSMSTAEQRKYWDDKEQAEKKQREEEEAALTQAYLTSAEFQQSPRQSVPAAPTSNPTAVLPTGWAVHNDPSTDKPYYHNSSTGVTSWDFPQADGSAATVVQSAPSQEDKDLKKLVDMGFGSKDQCRRMYHNCGGDMRKAVERFFAGGQA